MDIYTIYSLLYTLINFMFGDKKVDIERGIKCMRINNKNHNCDTQPFMSDITINLREYVRKFTVIEEIPNNRYGINPIEYVIHNDTN